MKVRMKATISGTRDSKPWPARGQVIDLPDEEAAHLCGNGMAEPVTSGGDDVEQAVDAPAETRAAMTTQSAGAVVPGNEDDDADPQTAPAPAAPAKTTAPPAKKPAAKPTAEK